MSFSGIRVLSLESRRAREIEVLIRRHEGDPFVAPSVQERALENQSDALRFIERLESGEFELVILMTGVGLEFLRDIVSTRMPLERFAAALRRVVVVSRGSKPLRILRALQVPAQMVIPEPNTWREIVAAVAGRPERRIAVQEYGRANLEMNAALESLGADVTSFPVYRWELPSDLGPLQAAVRLLAAADCDVVVFTSSIQLDHLLEVARGMNLEAQVKQSLRQDVAIASVGPVMTSTLMAYGLAADIVPKRPKMDALVKAAAAEAHNILARKRAVRSM